MIRMLMESPFVFGICVAALALLIVQFVLPQQSVSGKTRRRLRLATIVAGVVAIGLTASRFWILRGE